MNKMILAICLSALCLTGCPLERFFPQKVADGAARLTVLNVGAALGALSLDQVCGFKDPALIGTTISHRTGTQTHLKLPIGYASQTIEECTLEFKEPTSIGRDCHGVDTMVQGKLTVRGAHQTRTGIMTGIAYQPILPEGNTPIYIGIEELQFDNFKAYFSNTPDKSMTIKKGSARISAHIHLVKSKSTHTCSIPAPNLSIHAIELDAHKLFEVELPGVFSNFTATIDSGYLNNIQVGDGVHGDRVRGNNTLSGTLSVWENSVQVPSDGLGLDPDYKSENFNDSYLCEALGVDQGKTFDDQFNCSISDFVATSTARLLAQNTGGILSEISTEKHKASIKTGCGFSSRWNAWKNGDKNETDLNKFTIPAISCEIGQPEILLDTKACEIDRAFIAERTATCLIKCNHHYKSSPYDKLECRNICQAPFEQADTFIAGKAMVDGTATVEGELNWGNFGADINTKNPKNTSIYLNHVKFDQDGFSYFSKKPTENVPTARLELRNGTLSAGPLIPTFTRASDSESCALEKFSPIIRMENISAKDIYAKLTLKLPAPTIWDDHHIYEYPTHEETLLKTFSIPFVLNASNITAVNGNDAISENQLIGDITINGQTVNLGSLDLQPNYDPEVFEAAYLCNHVLPVNEHLLDGCEET